MKYLSAIFCFLIFSTIAFGQNENSIHIKLLNYSKNKVEFVLENISNDTLLIEQFYCEYKKNHFLAKSYTLSNDTLIINWSNNSDSINSPYKINYHIDGKRTSTSYTILPHGKICVSIKLFKNDFDKIKILKIRFNSADSISIKLK